MKARTLIMMAAVVLLITGCKSSTSSYASYETECLGIELDGSQRLRAWGHGRHRKPTMQQAAKNAISDVIFKGIRGGNGGCEIRPLIYEANAREKYEDYFNEFFSDNGDYKKYMTLKGAPLRSRVKEFNSAGRRFGVVVIVQRKALQEHLKADGIIK